ncbi:hypothetical protein D9615_003739 [Tricholomella constricta]|uniref:F-box domain-containing protein n=1 Tax=Tricholomella constricta TaxID=117010 RepID=A0A8H5M7S1_9AGAR|nr:hypothetical protein D9615_003739 [Tricholomella constricta]
MAPLTDTNGPVTIIALPNETLCAILLYFSPPTLTGIARVSQRFKAVAERLLYSSIHLNETLSESSPLPWKTLRWCESMRQRAHLIEATKKLQIRWQADLRSTFSQSLNPVCVQISDVLRLLVFLESLEIFLGPANLAPSHDEPIHAIERVIRGTHLPLLRHCSLGAEWTKGVQPYTSVLSSFLASASALRHLKLPDHLAGLDLPPGALPSLSSFRGSADTAANLLPGRPVQALALVGQDSDVTRENLPRMTLTSVPLRYLDLSAMSVRPLLLRNVSTHFPTLERLRVKLALRHTLHYAFSGIRLLAGLSAVLSAFRQLELIDLSPTDVDGVGRADAKEELVLVREWGRACPSLRRVIFPSETEWEWQAEGTWASC